MIIAPLHYRVNHASLDSTPNFVMQFLQYYLMGWIGVTLISFGAAEVLQFIFKKFDPSKRIFLTEGVAKGLLATTSIASFGGFIQLSRGPKVERVTINLPSLPLSFDGITIAQLSDVHIGPLLNKNFAAEIVSITMELKADLIALTGDFVDGTIDQLKDHVLPFQNLKAEHGVYYITGNHEYYSGADEWLSHFENFGIHSLRNSNKVLEKTNSFGKNEKLLIGGVFDLQGERFSPEHRSDPVKAAYSTESVDCKILLAHNPRSIEAATQAGFHLQLSGHTHAGQFYPFTWIARLAHQYFEGHYQVNEKTQIYVNRGTGFWGPPNRLGKTGEITLITLKSV
jgi:predicted MPP superfamily phosphohydrolase